MNAQPKKRPSGKKKDGLSQKLMRRLPYQVVDLFTDVMELYDKKRVLTKREKFVLAGFGVLLLIGVFSNPSEEDYKKHLNLKISQKLNTGEIKERFFNKVLYKKIIDDVENSIDRTNMLFLSVYSASASLYSQETPDLEASSIGFMGNFMQTSLNISSPLEESLRPPRKNGKAAQ